MEINNISGPDFMPGGFSINNPELENNSKTADNVDDSQSSEVSFNPKGSNIDTYV